MNKTLLITLCLILTSGCTVKYVIEEARPITKSEIQFVEAVEAPVEITAVEETNSVAVTTEAGEVKASKQWNYISGTILIISVILFSLLTRKKKD